MRRISMDHRVIGERSDAVLSNGYARWWREGEPSRGRRNTNRHNPFTIASDGARKQSRPCKHGAFARMAAQASLSSCKQPIW